MGCFPRRDRSGLVPRPTAWGKRTVAPASPPYGPYLTLGAALWVFIGPAFLSWYLALSSGLRG